MFAIGRDPLIGASASREMAPISRLPLEILEEIFSRVESVGALLQTCKQFQYVVKNSPKLRLIHAFSFARKLKVADHLTKFASTHGFDQLIKHANSEGFDRILMGITDEVLEGGSVKDAATLAKIWHKLGDKNVANWCLASAETTIVATALAHQHVHNWNIDDDIYCLLKQAIDCNGDLKYSGAMARSILRNYCQQRGDSRRLFLLYKIIRHLHQDKKDDLAKAMALVTINLYNQVPAASILERRNLDEGLMEIFSCLFPKELWKNFDLVEDERTRSIYAYRAITEIAKQGEPEEALKALKATAPFDLELFKCEALVAIACAFFEKREIDLTQTCLSEAFGIEASLGGSRYICSYVRLLAQKNQTDLVLEFAQSIPSEKEKNQALQSALVAMGSSKRSKLDEIQMILDKIPDGEDKSHSLYECICELMQNKRLEEAESIVDRFVPSLYKIAEAYLQQGNLQVANHYLALMEERETEPYILTIALLQIKLGHIKRAYALLSSDRWLLSYEALRLRAISLDQQLKMTGGLLLQPSLMDVLQRACFYFQIGHKKEYEEIIESFFNLYKTNVISNPNMLPFLIQKQAEIVDHEGYQRSMFEYEKHLKDMSEDDRRSEYSRWALAHAEGKNWKEARAVFDQMPEADKGSTLFRLTERMFCQSS